jgi:uncharacterized protein
MFLVNIGSLGGYWVFPERWTGYLDQITDPVVTILAEDKFATLFMFLFGLGFAMQINRAEASRNGFVSLYLRRLAVLFLIGVLALVFLAPVLILQTYALLGFFLLLFQNLKPRMLLTIVFVCLLIPFAYQVVTEARASPDTNQAPAVQQVEEGEVPVRQPVLSRAERIRVMTEGSYVELLVWRLRFAEFIYGKSRHYIVNMLGNALLIFLLGLWVGRRRTFEDLTGQFPFIRRTFWWSMAIGFGCTLVSYALRNWLNLSEPQIFRPLATLLWSLGKTGLCLFYATGLVLLYQRLHWKKRLAPLAAIGRLPLTNYLLQLAFISILFPAYGLGLCGRLGPATGIALALFAFALQVYWSIWWAGRFRYGPVEWLWRSFTYGKVPKMQLRSV